MAMLGDLQEFSLSDLFYLMEKSRKAGQLSIWAPDGIYRIWLCQGRVIAVLPSEGEHQLESLLMRSGLINEQAASERGSWDLDEPLGHRLQRQGLITLRTLATLFRHQLQVGLYSLFALESGQFSFLPNVPLPYREMTGLSKGALAAVLEALQQLKLDQRLGENLPQPDSYFWRSSPELPLYKLSPLEWTILEEVSPSCKLAELAQALGADLLQVRYAFSHLAKLGLISPCESSVAISQPALVRASKPSPAMGRHLEELPDLQKKKEPVQPSLVRRLSTLLKSICEKEKVI